MQLQRRALYNLLRQNWLLDSNVEVANWQVEDYRNLSLEALFQRLSRIDLPLDRNSFLAFAEESDSPEDLTDQLLMDRDDLDAPTQDQAYLVIFELWRRVLPERLCLSVFCDELDHQINLYDNGDVAKVESLQDILANLQEVLDENADQGVEPVEVFKVVSDGCANDIEGFLYDYVTEQLDEDNFSYASELVDGFYQYIPDKKWFDFLRARILLDSDPVAANKVFASLIAQAATDPDLEFCLEILAFMVQGGERSLFISLVKQTLPRFKREDDFQELLNICVDFYRCLDYEWEEQALQAILDARANKSEDDVVSQNDPHCKELVRILDRRAA